MWLALLAEHLGDRPTYTLREYLCVGQCDQGANADMHFQQAVQAIFEDKVRMVGRAVDGTGMNGCGVCVGGQGGCWGVINSCTRPHQHAYRMSMLTPWFACRPLQPLLLWLPLQEACYRLPQLRWSKRHPGKSRWVLYEMWPLEDPVTGELALLVTEQNITQVKEMEEKFCKRMGHLEEQLQDALLAAAAGHVAVDDDSEEQKPLIDLDSAAEKTLQLLDKLLKVRMRAGLGGG
jgi:hypothetical protein